MSWLSKALGSDGRREKREAAKWAPFGGTPQQQLQSTLYDESQGGGWQKAFEQSAGAYMSRAMPQFRKDLQLTREDNQRRGISTGDLGTSYEGDLASAFQQNVSDTLGGMAMNAYENNRNRYLALLTGKIAGDQAYKSDQQNMIAGIFSGAMKAGAAAYGAR